MVQYDRKLIFSILKLSIVTPPEREGCLRILEGMTRTTYGRIKFRKIKLNNSYCTIFFY